LTAASSSSASRGLSSGSSSRRCNRLTGGSCRRWALDQQGAEGLCDWTGPFQRCRGPSS
jgi:hypothetical protein